MDDLVTRLQQHDGHLGALVEEAAAEIERLRAKLDETDRQLTAIEHINAREKLELRAEIERLQELLRGVGANRYWEGRWRDGQARIERLRRFLEIALDAYEDVANDPNIGKPGHFVTQARALLAGKEGS